MILESYSVPPYDIKLFKDRIEIWSNGQRDIRIPFEDLYEIRICLPYIFVLYQNGKKSDIYTVHLEDPQYQDKIIQFIKSVRRARMDYYAIVMKELIDERDFGEGEFLEWTLNPEGDHPILVRYPKRKNMTMRFGIKLTPEQDVKFLKFLSNLWRDLYTATSVVMITAIVVFIIKHIYWM